MNAKKTLKIERNLTETFILRAKLTRKEKTDK
jgi:hypothetical protein